jgi:hypothetical protein
MVISQETPGAHVQTTNPLGPLAQDLIDDKTPYQSRQELLEQIANRGVNIRVLSALSMEELSDLLHSIRDSNNQKGKRGRPRRIEGSLPSLSKSDKVILARLCSSKGHVSSLMLSRDLSIPLSTIQRKRKRFESILVERNYVLRIDALGWRKANLFISTTSGMAAEVGKKILEMDEMIASVNRVLGENASDLMVEVIFRTHMELASTIDRIKSQEGVKGVIWNENLGTIGKNSTCYLKIIDSTA